jgi:hypothetical protein
MLVGLCGKICPVADLRYAVLRFVHVSKFSESCWHFMLPPSSMADMMHWQL